MAESDTEKGLHDYLYETASKSSLPHNSIVWFTWRRVLACVGGEWGGTLEAAGWTVALDRGEGPVVYEADPESSDWPAKWAALCEAEPRLTGPNTVEGGES